MKKKRSGHPGFYKILEKMAETYDEKSSDYNEGNPLGSFLECRKAGIEEFDGLMTRLGDKYSRLCSLNRKRKKGKKQSVKKESISETLLDNAVYSIIGIIILNEKKRRKSVK